MQRFGDILFVGDFDEQATRSAQTGSAGSPPYRLMLLSRAQFLGLKQALLGWRKISAVDPIWPSGR